MSIKSYVYDPGEKTKAFFGRTHKEIRATHARLNEQLPEYSETVGVFALARNILLLIDLSRCSVPHSRFVTLPHLVSPFLLLPSFSVHRVCQKQLWFFVFFNFNEIQYLCSL